MGEGAENLKSGLRRARQVHSLSHFAKGLLSTAPAPRSRGRPAGPREFPQLTLWPGGDMAMAGPGRRLTGHWPRLGHPLVIPG